MQPIIEVIVSPQGEASVKSQGYAGSACLSATKFLEEALGIAVAEKKTGEFYQQEQAEQHVQQ